MAMADVPGWRAAGRLAAGVGLGLLLVVAPGWAAESVHYSGGRLSVSFHDAPLRPTLNRVGHLTGVQFKVQAGVEGRLSARFSELPLAAAIRQLLVDYNFILLFGQDSNGQRRPERVLVLAPIGQPKAPAHTASANLADPRPARVVLRRQGDGPFASPGQINGQPVQLLVDTGATTVALSAVLAARLNLSRGPARQIDTASGRTTGYETVLDSLELGPLKLHGIRAIILPAMAIDDKVLLGLNALAGLELRQRGDTLVLQQPAD